MLLKIVTLLCVIGCAVAEQSPVLLWGAATEAKPALTQLQPTEFAALLQPFLEKYTIVAYLEDDLSVSDLSCHKVDSAQSCYAHLRSVSPKTYYANVENPLEALTALTPKRVTIDAEGKFSKPVEVKPGNVYLVNFDSVKLTRGATLEAHDTAMQIASKKLSGNIIYLYLSGTNNVDKSQTSISSRVRRSTAATQGGYLFRSGSQFLIFFTTLTYTPSAAGSKAETIVIQSLSVANVSATEFNVTMPASSGKSLTFSIKSKGGYYLMQNLEYDGVAFRNDDMNAPYAFSYHCGKQTLKAKRTLENPNNARLVWNNLQFQAPFGTINNDAFIFGDGWDCVYFFTPGILSAFFVSIVLLFILFTGICWMMDVNTMDRFEDPKGKPLTINAGE